MAAEAWRYCYAGKTEITRKALSPLKAIHDKLMGLTFVEVLSPCPTGWGIKPVDALKWIDSTMTAQYPLGVFKEV